MEFLVVMSPGVLCLAGQHHFCITYCCTAFICTHQHSLIPEMLFGFKVQRALRWVGVCAGFSNLCVRDSWQWAVFEEAVKKKNSFMDHTHTDKRGVFLRALHSGAAHPCRATNRLLMTMLNSWVLSQSSTDGFTAGHKMFCAARTEVHVCLLYVHICPLIQSLC